MRILVINGPNLNMLGKRNRNHYGTLSLDSINNELKNIAHKKGVEIEFFQSNHEGSIIDFLQKETSRNASGVLINPGALTHYGYSLRDALFDLNLPIAEVHLSNINNREVYRKIDVLDGISIALVVGKKERSYYIGLEKLIKYINKQ